MSGRDTLHRARRRANLIAHEHELAETATRQLAAIVESSEDAIIGEDLNGIITSWNRSAETIYGYTAQEMVGTSILRLLPEDRLDEERHIIGRIARGEREAQIDTVRQANGGRLVNVSIMVSPIKDGAGRIIGVSKVARDNTVRRREQEILRASQANMAAAQRIAHFGSWELELANRRDLDTNELRWSDEMFRIAGFEPGAVAVTNELFFRLVPEDEHESIRQAIAAAIRDRLPYSLEHTLTRPDGDVRVVQESGQIDFDPQTGRPVRIVGTAHDITERRKAERALRESHAQFLQLADHITDAFWIRSPDMREVHYVSPAFERIWGRPVDAVYTHPERWTDYIVAADRPRVQAAFASLRTDAERVDLEYRIARPDGEIRWVRVRAAQVRDAAGTLIRLTGIVTDTTEQKRVEAQLFQSQKMETIGRLAGGFAHEFNSILTTVIGQSELLLAGMPEGSPLVRNAAEIASAAARAAILTRQLQAYARQQILKPETLDLNGVLTDLEGSVRHLMSPSVDVRLALAAGLHAVEMDPGQMAQVIVNIVMNAADAMPAGGALVLETANVSFDGEAPGGMPEEHRAGDYVMLAISDTGTGMSDDIKARVFEPFFSTKGIGQGTGLGLSTSYGIIKQSGGHITIETEPGKGSTLRIYLPRVARQARAPRRAVSSDLPRGTETLLLVEADLALREFSATFLRRLGYVVLAAASPSEAASLRRQSTAGAIDLRLTDVMPPPTIGGPSGEQVLFTSANVEDAIRDHGMAADRVAVLRKPFTPTALAHKLREVLDRPMPAGSPLPTLGTDMTLR